MIDLDLQRTIRAKAAEAAQAMRVAIEQENLGKELLRQRILKHCWNAMETHQYVALRSARCVLCAVCCAVLRCAVLCCAASFCCRLLR